MKTTNLKSDPTFITLVVLRQPYVCYTNQAIKLWNIHHKIPKCMNRIHAGLKIKTCADLSFTPCVVAYFLRQVGVVGDQEVIKDGTRLDLNQKELHISLSAASCKEIQLKKSFSFQTVPFISEASSFLRQRLTIL